MACNFMLAKACLKPIKAGTNRADMILKAENNLEKLEGAADASLALLASGLKAA